MDMDRSFNCLRVSNVNNGRISTDEADEDFQTIPIYKDPNSDERKYMVLENGKVYLNELTVALLKNHIKGLYQIQYKTKLWKVNVHYKSKISTEADIVNLNGIKMEPLKPFEHYFRKELCDQNFMKENMENIHIVAIYDIADFPNKKVKLEEERIWVRYDRYDKVFFRRKELEEKKISALQDLKELIARKFNTLRNYSDKMISLRKENETETLDPTIPIDNLYNIGTLEIIVDKENDDESSPSRSEEKGKDNIESEQVQKAFQTKYQGSVLQTFYSRLKQFHDIWFSTGKYAPYLAIIQSSGSGKTRLVAELRTKGTYVLYICKRSVDSSGYPKSTPSAQQVLETIRDGKFKALLCKAIEEIKKQGWSAEEFWNIQIGGERECIEFWNTVLGSLSMINESSNDINDIEFVKNLFPNVDIPVVCCIDEAHELITREQGNDTYFVLWRRQIRKISWKGFFNILLSTNGKICNFLPPTMKDTTSARSAEFNIFPAYLDVNTTDVLASLVKVDDKNYDPKRIAYLGTPLWGSLAEAGVDLTELILLASSKIRNFSNKKDDYLANLACMACALALEVSPRIAEVDNLIASHMATAIGFLPDRTSILCAYPSDAILASGALNGIIGVGWENCLNTLLELFSRGVVEAGERGELVNRILFSMRYVEVVEKTVKSRLTYLEKVSLKSFLENMIDHDELLELLNHLEINEAEVGFNHWISLLATNMDNVKSKGHKFLTKDLVIEAYHRHAAIKMPFGFEHINHIIPFKYSSDYGVISIQNKNAKKSTFSTVESFTLTNPEYVFGEPQEGYKILGIYTDFNKGEENPKKETSGLKSADKRTTRSSPQEDKRSIIYVQGVEVFKFGDEINKCLSKILSTRPWPLDRCWSTFGEKELDRENAIRSFLPIVFEQEKGWSLIEKWKL